MKITSVTPILHISAQKWSVLVFGKFGEILILKLIRLKFFKQTWLILSANIWDMIQTAGVQKFKYIRKKPIQSMFLEIFAFT